MTERPFLPHDLGARNDPKLVALEIDGFAIGKAIWWDLIEMLYEQGGKLPTDYKTLAYTLRYPTEEQVRHLVEDFSLFHVEGGMFSNESAKARIERKEQTREQRRAAGQASGRSRGSSTPPEQLNEQMFNKCSTDVQQPLNTPKASVEQLNQINKNKSKEINQSAGAGAPAREDEEDFLMYVFFFRNLIDPVDEVGRCLENYKDTEIKNIRNVANKWNPDKTGIRFDDPRSLDLATGIYGYIREAANPHEAAEFLRHVDAIDVDKGRNEVKIRMLGADWQTSIQGVINEVPSLVSTFNTYRVTKRVNS